MRPFFSSEEFFVKCVWLPGSLVLRQSLKKSRKNTAELSDGHFSFGRAMYRWVPFNPNVDYPNSHLIRSPLEIILSHVLNCTLNSKFGLSQHFSLVFGRFTTPCKPPIGITNTFIFLSRLYCGFPGWVLYHL